MNTIGRSDMPPRAMYTPMMPSTSDAMTLSTTIATRAGFARRSPIVGANMLASSELCHTLLSFLASAEASYLNGEALRASCRIA